MHKKYLNHISKNLDTLKFKGYYSTYDYLEKRLERIDNDSSKAAVFAKKYPRSQIEVPVGKKKYRV